MVTNKLLYTENSTHICSEIGANHIISSQIHPIVNQTDFNNNCTLRTVVMKPPFWQ